mgnify:CR=1 FL=1
MIDAEQLKKNIIRDMRVGLSEEFDKNFERKAFFTKKWKKRADPNAKGSLLVVTGTLRRSIKAEERPNGVRFSSAVPYAQIHNEGGKGTKSVRAHTRRSKNGKTYTVKAGDSLWAIAAKYYGNGADYNKIFNANTDKISNPNLIYVGQVLTIP